MTQLYIANLQPSSSQPPLGHTCMIQGSYFSFLPFIPLERSYLYEFPNRGLRGLPLITYAPRVGGRGAQAFYTFPLRTTCNKGVDGSR